MRRAPAALGAVALAASALAAVAAAPAARAAGVTFYRPADGVLHLAGHGYGHGHGMSQWGAYGGAMSGADYRKILGWYYGTATFGGATGSIKVQITSDGRNGDGTYDALVKAASGVQAVDKAGHTLTLPTAKADGTSYDAYRALLATDGTFRVQARAGGTWTSLAPTGDGVTATSWTGWVRLVPRNGVNGVLTLTRSNGGNEQYRETLELDKTSGGAGITVNRLSLEHYLAGVVSSEMPCGWTPTVGGTKRLDALESQAVAARSYAAWRRLHPRSGQVDIVDSTADQAYHGYSSERTALSECPWTDANGTKTSAEAAAVAATAGQVLVDGNGAPIFAQYSASNGGFETSGSADYLPSKPDAWDGVPTDSWNSHAWTDSVTAGEISSSYPSIGSFTSLTVDSRESLRGTDQNGRTVGEQWGGRITGLTLTGTAGSVRTTGTEFQAALGLKSPWFTVVVKKPGAPSGVAATAGDGQATVTWSAPASDGGGGIRAYTVTASPSVPPVTVAGTARSATLTGLSNDQGYVFSVAASNTAGTGAASAAPSVTPSARVVFHPLQTARVLDTHKQGGAIRAGTTRSVKVLGVAGVPSTGVTAVALNLVTLDSTGSGRLRVFAHGASGPPTPQLSWTKGGRVNALVWAKVGGGGLVDLASSATTHAFVDVEGYYTPADSSDVAGDVMTASPASVVFDSHHTGAVPGGGSRSFPVVGQAGVPAGVSAVVLQVTAAHPAQRDYVRVWGDGNRTPAPIELYAAAGRYSDATVVVPVTGSGSVSVRPTYATHLVVSVLGWFGPASSPPSAGVTSLSTPPRRLVAVTVPARTSRKIPTGIPSSAGSALVTVTATGPVGAPLTVWPVGGRQPATFLHLGGASLPVSATVPVPAGSGSQIAVRNSSGSPVRLWVDLAGSVAA